jgi:hypothetical protein
MSLLQQINVLVFVALVSAFCAGVFGLRRLGRRMPVADGGSDSALVQHRHKVSLLRVLLGGVALAMAVFIFEVNVAAHEWNGTLERIEHRADACGQSARTLRAVCSQRASREQSSLETRAP